MATAFAGTRGRSFVTPDDVQDVARPTLSVRLGIEPEVSERVLVEILTSVSVSPHLSEPQPLSLAGSAQRVHMHP